jgi:hypothetical protein
MFYVRIECIDLTCSTEYKRSVTSTEVICPELSNCLRERNERLA